MITARTITRWLLALAYAYVGYLHLTAPAGFIAITPHFIPNAPLVVALTGCCELAGGLGLVMPSGWVRGLAWPLMRCASGRPISTMRSIISRWAACT